MRVGQRCCFAHVNADVIGVAKGNCHVACRTDPRTQTRARIRSADAAGGGRCSRRFAVACRNARSALALFCRRLFAAIGEGDKARRFRFMAVAKRSHSCGSVWQLFKKQKRGHTIAMVCLPTKLSLKSMRQRLRYGRFRSYRIGERSGRYRSLLALRLLGLSSQQRGKGLPASFAIRFCSGGVFRLILRHSAWIFAWRKNRARTFAPNTNLPVL